MTEPLTEAVAQEWIAGNCFAPGPIGRLGLELEFLARGGGGDRRLRRHHHGPHYPDLLTALQSGVVDGNVSLEPGGQVEFSTKRAESLAEAVFSTRRGLAKLKANAASRDLSLIGIGLDPSRPPRRVLDDPRYDAMAAYLSRWGGAGAKMMCSTASMQVNVEAGTKDHNVEARWDLIHAMGPTMVAAFANSSIWRGQPTGWKSTRQFVWSQLDPRRTGLSTSHPVQDLPTAYARWALAAPLMLVQRASADWSAPQGATFLDWIQHGQRLVPDRKPPCVADLRYHLTTLFPLIRPRGHLEIRYLDAQPGSWWIVPAAVIASIIDDPHASDVARDVCAETEDCWERAARLGLTDQRLLRSAQRIMALASDVLHSHPSTLAIANCVDAFNGQWTSRGLCPADDLESSGARVGVLP